MAAQLKTTPVSRRLGLFAGAAALVVALDQLAKVWARASLTPGSPVTFIPHVMDLSLVYNTGAAFSMGEGKGALFVLIAAVITCACAVMAYREETLPPALSATLGCVAGGGIGNAIDRVGLENNEIEYAITFDSATVVAK